MRPKYQLNLIFFSVLLNLLSCSKDKSNTSEITIGKVENIHSKVLNENRKVWIHVPENEDGSDSVRYPVLYLMDGNHHFKSVVGLMHQMSSVNGNTMCPKMIIVAIPNTNRGRDLTPTKIISKKQETNFRESGGGEQFTRFIGEELIPFIDKNYPTTKQRMLVGHSLGGLIVVNTLIKHPEMFDKYLAIDPSLWWNDGKSLREYTLGLVEKDFKGKSLFIGVANTFPMDTLSARKDTSESTIHFRAIVEFINTMKQTKSNGLDWQAKYYPDESHGSIPLISEYDAFQFLFRKIPISMDFAQLKQFEGKYTHQFEKGVDSFLDVVATDNNLFITESWSKVQMEFSPISDTDFYAFKNRFPVKFKKNSRGEVFELVAFNTDVWKKIE